MMIVDAEDDIAQRLARLVEHPCGRADRFARLEDALAVLPRGEKADRLPPLRAQLAGSFDGGIALGLVSGGSESGDAVTLLAAEQLVDRHPERLTLDVVESDVDRGNRRLQDPPAFEILAAIRLLPD